MNDARIRKCVRALSKTSAGGNAVWCAPTEETPLTVEGEPVTQLFVSVSGDFDVVSGGRRVATLPEYQVIGEVALLENLQSKDGAFHQAARATVLAEPGSRSLAVWCTR